MKRKSAVNESYKVTPALGLAIFTRMYDGFTPSYVQSSNTFSTYYCVKVELIGPTLMFEYVTEAPGDAASTSAGSRSDSARSTRRSRVGCSCRVSRIQPKHIGVMVIPNRHHQSHASFQSGAHRSKTAVSLECVVVAEGRLLGVTECCGDGVASHVRNL